MNEDMIAIAHAAVRLYAETHPRPALVNMQQATTMLGCGIAKVRSLVRHGTLRLNECGMIHVSEIDRVISPRSAA